MTAAPPSDATLVVPEAASGGSVPQFSLVIPTFNEARNIGALVDQLAELLDPVMAGRYELVVVDDDSPDRTWELAEAAARRVPALRVVRRIGERGLSTAVIRGWQASRGEWLGVIDGDLQHPPDVLLRLLEAMRSGADLAVASRHVEGGGVSTWSLARRMLSRGAQMLGLLILPRVVGRVSDPMSGFFVVRRASIAGRALRPLGYKILIEVIGRGTIRRIDEVGYVFRERVEGESKVTSRQYREYLQHLIRLRLEVGLAGRFIKFGLVGLSGVLVDSLALFLLHDPRVGGLALLPAKIVAAELAILNNFAWNDRWTFADRSERSRAGWPGRLLRFQVVCLAGLGLNVLVLAALTRGLHLHYLLANLIAIAAVTLWNFALNMRFSWADSRKVRASTAR